MVGDGKGYAPGTFVEVDRGISMCSGTGLTASSLSGAKTGCETCTGCTECAGCTGCCDCSASRSIGDAAWGGAVASGDLASSGAGVGGSEVLLNREPGIAGDLLDGRVLLRCTPEPVGVVTKDGVVGLGIAPECLDCLEEVDTFLRTPPNFRILSAAALDAAEADRPIPDLFRAGVVGVRA